MDSQRVKLVCALGSTLWLLLSAPAAADQLILPPEEGLARAQTIVVGTVVSQSDVGDREETLLRVEEVLKGRASGETIRVSVGPSGPPAAKPTAPDALPAPGTRVFVLLSGRQDPYGLAMSAQCVAIVHDGHVAELYHAYRYVGIDSGHWRDTDYVATYDDFYQARRKVQEQAVTQKVPFWRAWGDAIRTWFRHLFQR